MGGGRGDMEGPALSWDLPGDLGWGSPPCGPELFSVACSTAVGCPRPTDQLLGRCSKPSRGSAFPHLKPSQIPRGPRSAPDALPVTLVGLAPHGSPAGASELLGRPCSPPPALLACGRAYASLAACSCCHGSSLGQGCCAFWKKVRIIQQWPRPPGRRTVDTQTPVLRLSHLRSLPRPAD